MDENDNATATLHLSGVFYTEFLTPLHTQFWSTVLGFAPRSLRDYAGRTSLK